MKKLHFNYCMEIMYSVDVTRCFYTIKCIPQDSQRQKITNLNIEMIPTSKPEWSSDAQGNRYIFGCNTMPHDYFMFRISGDAECGMNSFEAFASENEEMIYRHSHGLTVPGEKIKAYYNKIKDSAADFEELSPYKKAQIIMECLHRDFVYEKGSTDVKTSAEEALDQGCGVCQDYAHIMVSLLNLAGCSARYVTGIIIGEGESHAWVEVIDNGKWYGLDPTNNVLVSESHIKIGVGRDASECQINRGTMHGGGDQKQKVSVSVTEIGPGQNLVRKGALL